LTEHFDGGKWPFWLSPRQLCIIPLSENFTQQAEDLKAALSKSDDFQIELDLSSNSLNKKIRNAQLMQFNFITVVGQEEVDSKVYDLRSRDGSRAKIEGHMEIIKLFRQLRQDFK
jgi:threonyl-tRNA synthetase